VGGSVPSLSVVVVASGEPAHLRAWLVGACRLCEPLGAEVVVCGGCGGLEEEFPAVSFVVPPAPGAPGAPAELRRAGLSHASGDIVLFTTDSATDLAERLAALPHGSGAPPAPVPEVDPAGGPERPEPYRRSAPLLASSLPEGPVQ
jgi:hypothetical protein